MVIKRYNVSLEEDIIDEAKKIMGDSGRKLSPVINNLLKKWIEDYKDDMEDEIDGWNHGYGNWI